MEVFSQRLKEERILINKSQKQMAELLGVPEQTYRHYEKLGTSNGRQPPMEVMCKMAKVLDVSLDYLFGLID